MQYGELLQPDIPTSILLINVDSLFSHGSDLTTTNVCQLVRPFVRPSTNCKTIFKNIIMEIIMDIIIDSIMDIIMNIISS